ncbi:MAG: ABC transporter ATP-binding protein [Chloroflexi bacterium]|nr:ABC transporter ATP-binding protein [Chloroflexota bacterium]
MNSNSELIISADRLTKHFDSNSTIVKAVDDVTFKLPKGKLIAIKGSSGSGKSTLLNLIGILDKPTSGTLIVDGVDLSHIHGKEEVKYRLSKVGFVFQSYNLIPNMNALENVMLPMELIGLKRSERQLKASKLLESVGIDSGRQKRRPSRLSGGEQQRVSIARALANDPSIVIADEPTGNLDSKSGRQIIELLRKITHEGRTVIVATHDGNIAKQSDILLRMKDGKLLSDSALDDN